jgi:hypothetical protein
MSKMIISTKLDHRLSLHFIVNSNWIHAEFNCIPMTAIRPWNATCESVHARPYRKLCVAASTNEHWCRHSMRQNQRLSKKKQKMFKQIWQILDEYIYEYNIFAEVRTRMPQLVIRDKTRRERTG